MPLTASCVRRRHPIQSNQHLSLPGSRGQHRAAPVGICDTDTDSEKPPRPETLDSGEVGLECSQSKEILHSAEVGDQRHVDPSGQSHSQDVRAGRALGVPDMAESHPLSLFKRTREEQTLVCGPHSEHTAGAVVHFRGSAT